MHAGFHMAVSQHGGRARLLLALIAGLFLSKVDTAFAIQCSKGCKQNRQGQWACKKRGKVFYCTRIEFDCIRPDDDDEMGDQKEEEEPFVCLEGISDPEYEEDTGIVYDYEDRRYEYEDGTIATAFDIPITPPFADGPIADGPIADEPFADESFADEPFADEPFADEPFADEPFADEPISPPTSTIPSTVDAPTPAPNGRCLRGTPSCYKGCKEGKCCHKGRVYYCRAARTHAP
jgi:hypothetical protein